ncbi:Flp pilus assembly protein CpaB [Silvibacterium sp.]|uniref:Flp pilus assembly protein CpaB n=1 Tax=Silvibacterium sp. TaxID=1964179 RepID=UPI0039E4065F
MAVRTRRLLLALLVAVLVSGLFTLWIGSRLIHAHAANAQGLQYYAASHALDAGEVLTSSDVKQTPWPSSIPLTGAFTRQQDVVGRAVLFPVAAGQPLLDSQLAAAGSGAGLSTKIPTGMRAVSVKSDQVVGVAGFLFPGTHVDVLVTYTLPTSTMPVTSTVLQDAEILTAGEKMEPDPQGKPATVDVVTLLVSPDDAERVVLANAQGHVHLVLRNGRDNAQPTPSPIQLTSLGTPAATEAPKPKAAPRPQAPVAAPVPAKYNVQVINGDKSSTESFQ